MLSSEIANVLYPLLVIIGLLIAFFFLGKYFKKIGISKDTTLDYEILFTISAAVGFLFALLFQNVYDFIENPSSYSWSWSMTFYGGLLGGILCFFTGYFLWIRKKHPSTLLPLTVLAAAGIPLVHGFGRIGCFLSGCCYGLPISTDSPFYWMGVKFLTTESKVWPTNLMEAIFLFILSAILFYMAFKKNFRYNLATYFASYGLFRFLIEFLRGDHRGSLIPGISPSQFWAILFVVAGIGLFLYQFLSNKKKEKIIQ